MLEPKMPASEALKIHLETHRQIIAENERAIEMMKAGQMATRTNGKDTTADTIASLERQNETLQKVIKDFGGA